MNVLVTGGAGFIGSHLVERLVRDGLSVRVLDDFSTGHRENLVSLRPHIDLIEGDIRDHGMVRTAMRGVEVVFHQAALCSVPRSIADPRKSNAVNVNGTLNVLTAAKEEGVRRVVYASSSSVYGHNAALPKRETQAPVPASPYAITKLTGEMYCRNFFQLFGLETFSLRYFNVFGSRQDPDSPYAAAIPRFVSALLRGDAPTIYGDGLQSRDFTYVDNVVEANILAMKANSGAGEVFNIGCGQGTTLVQLIDRLTDLLEVPLKPVFTGPRAGDVRHSLADVTKARALLGYRPGIDLPTGLGLAMGWYRSRSREVHAR